MRRRMTLDTEFVPPDVMQTERYRLGEIQKKEIYVRYSVVFGIGNRALL